MVSDMSGSILMQKYEMGRMLGKGTFAKVYHARNLINSQSNAIKVIDKEKVLRVGLTDQIKREIAVMRLARHPNIIELYEVMATKNKIYFVLEYVKGGELFNKVSNGNLEEDISRKYFQQLIGAVDFCHSRGIYHRDLKPENLLVDENGNLKVSDFGLSAFTECRRQDGLLHTICGTPAYVAPEVIGKKGYDGAKADIWSCGVILFVLLAGYLPFHDSNIMEMYRKIGKAEFKCPNWFSSDVKRLISKILDPNPNTRISIAKIKENTWFKKGIDQKLIDNNVVTPDTTLVDVNSEEKITDDMKPANLNAFDIISLSAGLDLSGLIGETPRRREAKFTSTKTRTSIVSKIEEVARNLGLKVKKNDGGVIKMEGTKVGRKGVLGIDAEIFEVTPSFHLVEIKKSNGDTLEYQKVWKRQMRPALKDIVWVWQGDQPVQSQFSPEAATMNELKILNSLIGLWRSLSDKVTSDLF